MRRGAIWPGLVGVAGGLLLSLYVVSPAAARPPDFLGDAPEAIHAPIVEDTLGLPPFVKGRRIDGSGRLDDGLVVLTFDDGPSPKTTPTVLAALHDEGVVATFFVVGRRLAGTSRAAEASRALVREELAEGNAVGSHTVHHVDARRVPFAQYRTEVVENEELLSGITGLRPWAFRPPYGTSTSATLGLLYRRGYTPVLWNIDARDAFTRRTEAVRRSVLTQLRAHGGGLVLLHDTHPWTVRAVPLILADLRRESCQRLAAGRSPFVIVSLDRLFEPLDGPAPLVSTLESAREGAYRTSVVDGCRHAPATQTTQPLPGALP